MHCTNVSDVLAARVTEHERTFRSPRALSRMESRRAPTVPWRSRRVAVQRRRGLQTHIARAAAQPHSYAADACSESDSDRDSGPDTDPQGRPLLFTADGPLSRSTASFSSWLTFTRSVSSRRRSALAPQPTSSASVGPQHTTSGPPQDPTPATANSASAPSAASGPRHTPQVHTPSDSARGAAGEHRGEEATL